MLLRWFTDFILRSRKNAFIAVFLISFIPLLGSVNTVVAAFITLQQGVFGGAIAICAASLPFLLQSISYANILNVFLCVIIVANNILTWFLALLLRKYNSLNLVCEILILITIVAIGIIYIIFPAHTIQAWWLRVFNQIINFAVSKANNTTYVDVEVNQLRVIMPLSKYATGLLATFIIFNSFISLVLARAWQKIIFSNVNSLRKELLQIRMGLITSGIFIISLVLAMFSFAFFVEILPVLYFIFFISGLSLLHQFFFGGKKASNIKIFLMILMYLAIILSYQISVKIIASIALLHSLFISIHSKSKS